MVWAWLGRAGVYLMARFGKKKLLAMAATFGAVIVAAPKVVNWTDEKKDDIIADAGKPIIAAVGAGIGIVLLLVLLSSRGGGK